MMVGYILMLPFPLDMATFKSSSLREFVGSGKLFFHGPQSFRDIDHNTEGMNYIPEKF